MQGAHGREGGLAPGEHGDARLLDLLRASARQAPVRQGRGGPREPAGGPLAEARPRALAAVAPGDHRAAPAGRRDEGAARDGLHLEPLPAAAGLGARQRPAHGLALGSGAVPVAAGGPRRRQQLGQLAVLRGRRLRPETPHVQGAQPGAPLRPGGLPREGVAPAAAGALGARGPPHPGPECEGRRGGRGRLAGGRRGPPGAPQLGGAEGPRPAGVRPGGAQSPGR
mmetsp:Transcript_75888/g.214599  ORF Transcript_75888/g.214599 Transcript_75888/m.214599 type:complete len:225 (+) Transcript_75888:1014-1688(+)